MGLISRLKRITRGRIEAFLDAVEKPEVVLPQLITEMAAKLKQAANAEAKALTAVKGAQRKCDEADGRTARMAKGSELALKAGELDTARQALAAQLQAEREMESLTRSLQTAQIAYDEAKLVRRCLKRDLDDLRRRKDEIIRRARAASAGGQRTAQQLTLLDDGRNILDTVARMEDKVEHDESIAAAGSELNRILGPGLVDRRLEELANDREVDKRLDELKRKHAPEGPQ